MAAITANVPGGNWDLVGTWAGGVVPGSGDTATIPAGSTVTLRDNRTVGTAAGASTSALIIQSGGTFQFDTTVSSTLILRGRLDLQSGGAFYCGTSGSPVPAAQTQVIEFSGAFGYQNLINGRFELHGCPAYHMGAAGYQKTRITANLVAGAGVGFATEDPVDWSLGDTLWFSTGGSPTDAPTDCEIVVITTKMTASTYRATFVNNHFGNASYGDCVVHASRNVIVRGVAGQGFTFYGSTYTTGVANGTWNIDWVRFENAGVGATALSSAIVFQPCQTNYAGVIDNYKLNNCVFEGAGKVDVAAGLFIQDFVGDQGIKLADYTSTNIANIHFYGSFYRSLYVTASASQAMGGEIYLGHISSIRASRSGIEIPTTGVVHSIFLDGFWYACDTSSSTNTRIGLDGYSMAKVSNFKIHRSYSAIDWDGDRSALFHDPNQIDTGEIFHAYAFGVFITKGGVSPVDTLINSVKFYDIRSYGINLGTSGLFTMIVKGCAIDNCNNASVTAKTGAVYTVPSYSVNWHFIDTTFGTLAVNRYYNVYIGNTLPDYNARVLFEGCTFKLPNPYGMVGTYDWLQPPELGWSVNAHDDDEDWRTMGQKPPNASLEYVGCSFLNAGDVEQWATMFPSTTRVAVITGFGQMHELQPADPNYIDGTFGVKIMPFMAAGRCHATKAHPVLIPVDSGQTLTVKLQLKKNLSQESGRLPQVHLFGCGIDTQTSMTNVNNVWEEVTVSGVSTRKGVVQCWVSCYGVNDFYTAAAPPARTPAVGYTWAYPYDCGLGFILYADGMLITRT